MSLVLLLLAFVFGHYQTRLDVYMTWPQTFLFSCDHMQIYSHAFKKISTIVILLIAICYYLLKTLFYARNIYLIPNDILDWVYAFRYVFLIESPLDRKICVCLSRPLLNIFNNIFIDNYLNVIDLYLIVILMVLGKNPKPICINPPRLRNLKVCAKFYNIFFPGRNFHFCLAMTGQWRQFELFNMAFDCLR